MPSTATCKPVAATSRSASGGTTRNTRASGIAFVACFAAAAALYGSGTGSAQAAIADYYAHHAGRQVAGFAVLLAGCVCLLAFVTEATASPLGRASGLAATVLLAVGNAAWAATAFTVELEPGYVPSAASHLLLEDAAWIVIVSAAALAIPFVAVVSAERERLWFRVLGGLTLLALAAAYWYAPLAVFLLWIVLTPPRAATPRAGRRAAPECGGRAG